MDRLKDPPTWLKVATTQEIDLQPWAPRQWTSTTTRWRCGLILLPSLTLRSPHPQGEKKKWGHPLSWLVIEDGNSTSVYNNSYYKGSAHMVEGGHHPRNRPPTLGTTSVDFYHYPVTVWAYSTPQPNTEVPAPTGGVNKRSPWCLNYMCNAYHRS